MKLSDFTIGMRLAIGFGSLLLLLVAIASLTNFLNARNRTMLTDGLSTTSAKNVQVATMKSAMLEVGIAMRNIGLDSEVTLMQKAHDQVKAHSKRYTDASMRLRAAGLTAGEEKMLTEIAALDVKLDAVFKEAIGHVLAFNSEGAAQIIARRIDPLNQQTLALLNRLVEMQLADSRALVEASNAAAQQLMVILLALGVVSVGLGIVFATYITRSITVPLRGAVTIAKKVAAGELTSRVQVEGKDETSELMEALRMMNESLVKTVGEVRSGTDQITTASREIASGNADLSARTESQASSLEETASSMEQLTSTVQQNADNARQANLLAVSASSVAAQGGAIVAQVVHTMNAIKGSSRKVVDIIAVIDAIAFQTNILALNAAVEAARAGEQGRGFAVVAAEVRNLAQRSAGAAKQIKALIVDSVDKVEDGSKLVDEAGQTMELIVTSVKQVAALMSEISAATREQGIGIAEVNQAITQIDEMTQQNAALVEQAAAAAESMLEQAQHLSRAVLVFKLPKDDRQGPALSALALVVPPHLGLGSVSRG